MYVGLLYTSEVIFVFICIFLVLLILIQKGRGGGLASAFGGAGGQTAFGSKTGDVLTWTTSVVFGIFLTMAVILNLIANQIDKARGGSSATAAAVAPAGTAPLTAADRSTLPKGMPQEPAAPMPNPGATPTPTGAVGGANLTPAPAATPAVTPAITPAPTTLP